MNLSLHYLVREPKIIAEKNPLLLLLHGYGSNEADLFSFADELPDSYFVIAVRAPLNLQYGSYAWYSIDFDADQNKFSNHEQGRNSRDLVAFFIDELLVNYPIDSKAINLIGFSQGAILSYSLALSFPEKIRKVAAMSGYLDSALLKEDFEKNDFSNLKIFASHGVVDQVIPVSWARKSIPVLEKIIQNVTYKEYPIGHGISPQNFYDLKTWLSV